MASFCVDSVMVLKGENLNYEILFLDPYAACPCHRDRVADKPQIVAAKCLKNLQKNASNSCNKMPQKSAAAVGQPASK